MKGYVIELNGVMHWVRSDYLKAFSRGTRLIADCNFHHTALGYARESLIGRVTGTHDVHEVTCLMCVVHCIWR